MSGRLRQALEDVARRVRRSALVGRAGGLLAGAGAARLRDRRPGAFARHDRRARRLATGAPGAAGRDDRNGLCPRRHPIGPRSPLGGPADRIAAPRPRHRAARRGRRGRIGPRRPARLPPGDRRPRGPRTPPRPQLGRDRPHLAAPLGEARARRLPPVPGRRDRESGLPGAILGVRRLASELAGRLLRGPGRPGRRRAGTRQPAPGRRPLQPRRAGRRRARARRRCPGPTPTPHDPQPRGPDVRRTRRVGPVGPGVPDRVRRSQHGELPRQGVRVPRAAAGRRASRIPQLYRIRAQGRRGHPARHRRRGDRADADLPAQQGGDLRHAGRQGGPVRRAGSRRVPAAHLPRPDDAREPQALHRQAGGRPGTLQPERAGDHRQRHAQPTADRDGHSALSRRRGLAAGGAEAQGPDG